MQDLDHKAMDDRAGIEDAVAPAVSGLTARGTDQLGIELVGDVLPKPLQDGINLVMHQVVVGE